MDHVAKDPQSIPAMPAVSSAGAQARTSARDADLWTSLLMALALTSIAVGITWDISWHETIGRDTFWTPAHMAIYLGGVLAGCTSGWLAIKHTFFPGPNERDVSVNVFGARAPLGAWVAIWGALAMITSGPFDNWWHNAYGLDVKIISPPHTVLGLGMLAVSAGVLLLVLTRQNRLQDSASPRGSGMFIYAGGVFVLLGSVFLLEYIFPNQQHGGKFYIVCAMMFPARFVAIGYAARVRWPVTRVALVYMAGMCAIDWVLEMFPGHPKLAPIFNPVTHMVALPFPLLLIFPAFAIDLVLIKAHQLKGLHWQIVVAILLGAVFIAVLLPVQWWFSKFLISPLADNWVFMSDRIWSYGSSRGEWHHQFWDQYNDSLTSRALLWSWGLATVSSGVGLFFGHWMRKVRR